MSLKPTMSGEAAVAILRGRCAISVARSVLKKSNLTLGIGWDAVLAKVTDPSGKHSLLATKLADLAVEQICCGNGYFQVFADFQDGEVEALALAASKLSLQPSVFSTTYPVPMPGLPSAAIPDATPKLVEIRSLNLDGDVALVFCARRAVYEPKTYDVNNVSKEVLLAYPGIERFVTIRKLHVQTYDTVIFRVKLNRIEVKTDSQKLTHDKKVDEYFASIYSSLDQQLPAIDLGYGAGQDLFPAVGSMYADTNIGTVWALDHHSDTGRVSRDRMIGGGTHSTDLRAEKGHAASMKACTGITTCFAIEATLSDNKFAHAPTLILPGRHVHATGVKLQHGEVSECANAQDFRLAMIKIVKHI